jgi:hypothetical protein
VRVSTLVGMSFRPWCREADRRPRRDRSRPFHRERYVVAATLAGGSCTP